MTGPRLQGFKSISHAFMSAFSDIRSKEPEEPGELLRRSHATRFHLIWPPFGSAVLLELSKSGDLFLKRGGSGEGGIHLEHGLGLVEQLLGLLADLVVFEDLGVAPVRIPAPQLPRLRSHRQGPWLSAP